MSEPESIYGLKEVQQLLLPNERKTFCARKSIPPSIGSRECAVTAENVVNPAQNPGQ